jgi:predicted nucleotidyltransferase component of viral defense system
MFNSEAIIKLSAKLQSTQLNVRREYLQHLFLSYFYKQEKTDLVFFKGGTALRLIYGSPRFSEDLDFDSPLADAKQIESSIIGALADISQEGVAAELDEAKTTSGGYLSVIRFSAWGQTVPIRLEISFQDKKKHGYGVFIASEMCPDYSIVQLSEDQLVKEKISALTSRKKPRDFYDFYFVLRRNLLPEKKGEIMKQVLAALQESDINFDRELREFLPVNHHLVIKNFKTTLEREISRFL